MKQLSQEIDTLTKKFEEERKKNDEMMTMLMSERLNQETEALSKVDQALTDIQWKEDLEDQLKRKEERCKELEGILKSMEDKSRQNGMLSYCLLDCKVFTSFDRWLLLL